MIDAYTAELATVSY